tara:strand:- start:776 stop:1633 length:858 start_codon:yes stop_codon:yes gene_type:complete
MTNQNNPLSNYYRNPKMYVTLPSKGVFYNKDIVDMPENGELPVFPMTAKDEVLTKNPDALLNGEAVSQLILSCVPNVKQPLALITNDVNVLLVAIQGASNNDELTVSATCPECESTVEGVAAASSAIDNMRLLEQTYEFTTKDDLVVEVRPITYSSTIKAGLATFKASRSFEGMAQIEDDDERLRVFNENFIKMSEMNFEILVDSINSITIGKGEDLTVVTDRAHIRDYMLNCEAEVGREIETLVGEINNIGLDNTVGFVCDDEKCSHEFESKVNFDPVNFFTTS